MSDTQTLTLTDFLLARIAEDEAVARSAKPGPWYLECSHGAPDNQIHHVMGVLRDKYGDNPVSTDDHETVDHIARHDPARVLAECEAKRRIVEWHKSWPVLTQTPPTFEPIESADPNTFAMRASQQMAWLTEQEYRNRFGSEPPTVPILRLLALPYAAHPDYREEWKP